VASSNFNALARFRAIIDTSPLAQGSPMKQLFVLTAALITSTMAMAYDSGRVVSVRPVMERVAVPRLVCTVEQVQLGRRAPGRVKDVQHCTTQTVFEYRPVAYDVVYDHAGRRHSVRTSAHPGSTIIVGAAPAAIPVLPRGVVQRGWEAPQAPDWYGHRRQPAVPYISTERRGNTWEDDFLDRQMR